MNILMIGNGKIGYTLAECLSSENHDVTIIDTDEQALTRAAETLDVMCVKGNAANAQTLLSAGCDRADVLIATTANDELNMVCCLIGKRLGARYAIARIRDPEYTDSLTLLQKELSIDMVINPERTAAFEISRLLRFPFADGIESFAHGHVEMVEFRVDDKDGLSGIPLREMHGRLKGVLFCACVHGNETVIPGGDTVIQSGDRLYVVGDQEAVTAFFRQIGRRAERARSVMIIGGGHISFYLAKTMSEATQSTRLTIIEQRAQRCAFLAEQLPQVTVVNGDGTDRELLDTENIRAQDALVCLTDRDEENLILGLYAVRAGIPKVIVKVNRLNFMDVIGEAGVDTVVSPKRLTADAILHAVRARSLSKGSAAEKVYRLIGGQAEALEFTAQAGARYLNRPLSQLHHAPGVLVAVIVHNGQIIIPNGSDHIEAGDAVIVITTTQGTLSLESAFS